jgi:DNA invertase Pin-like site-specific DNA recombinase
MTGTNPEKRLIGYARVSTYGQTLDSQLEQLRKAGCNSRKIYREKVTGARPDRRELLRMLRPARTRRRGDGDPKLDC